MRRCVKSIMNGVGICVSAWCENHCVLSAQMEAVPSRYERDQRVRSEHSIANLTNSMYQSCACLNPVATLPPKFSLKFQASQCVRIQCTMRSTIQHLHEQFTPTFCDDDMTMVRSPQVFDYIRLHVLYAHRLYEYYVGIIRWIVPISHQARCRRSEFGLRGLAGYMLQLSKSLTCSQLAHTLGTSPSIQYSVLLLTY